jgi:ketosteroid isomerase-like protein
VSPEDLDTVSRAYDAFARGDMDTLRGFLASDIEWRTTPDVPFLGTYQGVDEFFGGMNDFAASFGAITTDVEEVIDAGEHAVVRHRMRGRGSDSGAEVDLVLWQVVSVRDGRITRMHDYLTGEDALTAARDDRRY